MSEFLNRLVSRGEDAVGEEYLDKSLFLFSVPSEAPHHVKEITLEEPTAHAVERISAIEALRASGVFDVEFYSTAYPDVIAAGVDPLEHFFDIGWTEGKRPNFYFEPQWYLSRYLDVVNSGYNPFFHYVLYGDKEGRNPGPLFETEWYRKQNGLGGDGLALGHYLMHRKDGTVSPMPDFDITYYAKNNHDVIGAGVDPFEHFVSYGYKEWRNPSEELDLYYYVQKQLKGQKDIHPFFHYLENRGRPGVFGRMPDDEVSIPREIKRFTKPSVFFEEYKSVPVTAPRRAKVYAYYLPQFHSFPENDEWWGNGFTEWSNIPRGVPRFAGHYQPRVPRDLGYYDLHSAELMRRQIQMAQGNGVSGFIFYYYWFNGKRLMDMPLESLLNDASLNMPFALMWANENWTRRWDGSESEVLISQDYRVEDDVAMATDFAKHFKDPRYIRLQGRPLLTIYRPGVIPNCAERIASWRQIFQDEFGENPVIFMVQAFGDTDPEPYGLDGAMEFPPHKLTQQMRPVNQEFELLDLEFSGKIYHYDSVVAESLNEPAPLYPLIKTVVPSWDNDARRQGAGLVVAGSTPEKYEAWLAELVERAEQNQCFGESIVCVNAWNEWCEGTYLEPDLHFGSAYLNATGRAVCGIKRVSQITPKLLLVGHDAFPSGAQHLLLNIGRTLSKEFGIHIEFLLLGSGGLEKDYKCVAPTHVSSSTNALKKQILLYKERGFSNAIVNTSAGARIIPDLVASGIESVLLIHELPRLLKEKNLLEYARTGISKAKSVVFPANYVRDRVVHALEVVPNAKEVIQAQGNYKDIAPSKEAAIRFRSEYNIPDAEPVVVGIGYADLRKGFDLFLQVWRLLNQDSSLPVHVCWVGGIDPDLYGWLSAELEIAKNSRTFHMLGYVADITPALSSASVFALTSREDPFPTVVLEAASAGVPVVAFDQSGGMPEAINTYDLGAVVPHGDVIAMSRSIRELIDAKNSPSIRKLRSETIRENFSFSDYTRKLLNIALPGAASISVVVPNYNYARYMPERLGSIFRQTYPVVEVIVLDDKSSDDSLSVIPMIAADWGREIKLVVNEKNSGSVFAQWRKAAELASGDWLWIAEADDLSHPTFLESIINFIGNNESIVMAFSDSRTIDVDGTPQWSSYKDYYATVEPNALSEPAVYDAREFMQRFLGIKNLILNASSVVWNRKALLAALNECEEDLKSYQMAGDWRLYLQALSASEGRVAYLPAALNVHRRHASSVTHALAAEQHILEIQRCHAFIRSCFGKNISISKKQAEYIKEVTKSLGLLRSKRLSEKKLPKKIVSH